MKPEPGDLDLEPVGEHARPAGDGAAIAAGLADDRRALARDRALVDRGDTLDDLAVGGDELARRDDDDVAAPEIRRRYRISRADHVAWRQRLRVPGAADADGRGGGAHLPQRRRLGLAAPLGHGLGEVGEQDGEPQPDDELELEFHVDRRAPREIVHEEHAHQERANLDHEHDGVLRHRPRVQLLQSIERGGAEDRGIPERLGLVNGVLGHDRVPRARGWGRRPQ
jgi:hypothetical protein